MTASGGLASWRGHSGVWTQPVATGNEIGWKEGRLNGNMRRGEKDVRLPTQASRGRGEEEQGTE